MIKWKFTNIVCGFQILESYVINMYSFKTITFLSNHHLAALMDSFSENCGR